MSEAQAVVQQGESGDERSAGGSLEGEDRLVPVSEAIRYRKRAQAAEQELGVVGERLQLMEQEPGEARQTVSDLERRQRIDALLAEAEAVDLDAARLLTEAAVQQMDEPDVQMAVEDLRRHKPYLFRQRARRGHGVMAARSEGGALDEVEDAAQQAVSTGHRRDLLRYLRLRRK